MRFITPLLFSVIASSILAVCPLPVDEKPERPVGLAIQRRKFKMLATVTFIDRLSGRPTLGDTEEASRLCFTRTLTTVSGVQLSKKVDYKGSWTRAPGPDGPKWGYFTIVGVPKECTDANPCFGWIAHGNIKRNGKGRPGSLYIGISKGLPGWNQFQEFFGEPNLDNDNNPSKKKVEQLPSRRKEWRGLLDEFKLNFMAKFIATVTFIDIKGADLGTSDTTNFPQGKRSSMSTMLNALDNTEAGITYKGPYAPSKDKREWVYFKITGLPVECTDVNPCFGWFAGGNGYTDGGRKLLPGGKGSDTNQWYTAISKGKPGQDHFVPFKGEPSEEGEKAKEKAEKMAEEWKTILAEFQKLYKPTAAEDQPMTE